MPKRSNLFQQVVAIIYEHMAGAAETEESALLPPRVTGTPREVDVVIHSQVAGHEVIVSVEATATDRRADVNWVERVVKKHSDLPTSKLVLVSEAGFTADARRQAEHDGALPLAPTDLANGDPALAVVGQLPSLWPKTLTLKPTSATALVRTPDGNSLRVRDLTPDHLVFFEDGALAASPHCARRGSRAILLPRACDGGPPRSDPRRVARFPLWLAEIESSSLLSASRSATKER